jgi:D-alanyl-D-alanine dipeptidase
VSLFSQQIRWIEANFRELTANSEVVLNLRYASEDNFMKQNIYQGFDRCFLSPAAFLMFSKACEELRANYPDLQFVIWDTLRPRSIQAQFYDHLSGTPFQDYVAAPYPGSLHNFGMAMDLTLQTKDGLLLDMGTDFDDFREIAQPQLEMELLKSGELTLEQHANRLLLRRLMEDQGFKVLPHEWWHFNAMAKELVYEKYPILE